MELGGRADKLGNRFEAIWVALQLLRVLNGDLKSVEIEPLGDEEQGVDLWIVRNSGEREAQQCKRGNASRGTWSIADLESRRILIHLKKQLDRHQGCQFRFISGDPAPDFRELSERAEGAGGDPESFFEVQVQPFAGPRKAHAQFCRALDLDVSDAEDRHKAFALLKRSTVEQFPPGRSGEEMALSLARLALDGEPSQALAVLTSFVSEEAAWARPLTGEWLSERLAASGLRRRTLTADETLATRIEELCNEFDESLANELIADDLIKRGPAERLAKILDDEDSRRLVAVLGDAGSGKSCVLLSIYRDLRIRGVPCLPIRLDRRMPAVSARRFGTDRCDLPDSPGLCLHALAGDRPAVLILDQLDAIRWTSAHGPAAWEACKASIRDALVFPRIRVIVACRSFDWETDPQIQAWKKDQTCEEIKVPPLSDNELRGRVERLGGNYDALSNSQRRVLSLPLGLSLWSKLRSDGDEAGPFSTTSDLIRAFWEDRLSKAEQFGVAPDRALESVARLLDFMSSQERLDAPESVLDADPTARDVLTSLGILARAAGRVGFAHQSYYDYQIARRVIDAAHERSRTCAEWLAADEQTLFRREQLRLALEVLRQEDPSTFVREIASILDDERIRFHLKHLTLQVLGTTYQPSNDEVDLVLEYLSRTAWTAHIEDLVLNKAPGWLDALGDRGIFAEWLDSGSEECRDRALQMLRRFADQRGDRVARLLSDFESRPAPWPERVASMVRFADAHDSRELFELQLRAMQRGQLSRFFIAWRKLAKSRPEWFVEALEVALRSTAAHVAPDDDFDSVFGGQTNRSELIGLVGVDFDIVAGLAIDDPLIVWNRLVPAIVELVMAARIEEPDETGLIQDRIWGDGLRRVRPDSTDRVLDVVAQACSQLAKQDLGEFEVRIIDLASSALMTCRRLAAMILVGAPTEAADLAYRWISLNPCGLRFGSPNYEDSWALSRGILGKFGEACSTAVFHEVENMLLRYRDPDEWGHARWVMECRRRGDLAALGNSVGRGAYLLLSAMPLDRLSPQAKRELRILGRKFGPVEKCVIRGDGTWSAWVGPNFPMEALQRMSDKSWLALIARETIRDAHGTGRRGLQRGTPFGEHVGLHDVALALEEAARREPIRFAKLSLQLPATTPSRILGSILEGCGQLSCPTEGSEGKPAVANWAPAPAELIEKVLERWDTIEDREAARRFCSLLAKRAEAAWSDDAIDKLRWCATEHPDPDPSALPIRRPEETVENASAETLRNGAINCVRGEAAIAIEQLLFADSRRLEKVRGAIEGLVVDPSPVVRCAAVGACVPLLNLDRQLAVELFLRAVSNTQPTVLAVRDTAHFLRFATYHQLSGAVSVARRMMEAPEEEVAQAGTHWAVAFVLQHPRTPRPFSPTRGIEKLQSEGLHGLRELLLLWSASVRIRRADRRRPLSDFTAYAHISSKEHAREVLGLYQAGLRSVDGGEAQRRGAAQVAATSAGGREFFFDCAAIIRKLVDDESKDVRRVAFQVFRLDDLLENEGASEFVQDVVGSQAFRDDPSPLLWALKVNPVPLTNYASAVLAICDVFATDLASDSRDLRTAIAGDTGTVSELLVRLYGEASDEAYADLRSACLDRWDRLLWARVGHTDETLREIDLG